MCPKSPECVQDVKVLPKTSFFIGNQLSIKCEQIEDHLLSCIIYSHAPGNTVTQTVVLTTIILHIAIVTVLAVIRRQGLHRINPCGDVKGIK